jgi:hypothetical protein
MNATRGPRPAGTLAVRYPRRHYLLTTTEVGARLGLRVPSVRGLVTRGRLRGLVQPARTGARAGWLWVWTADLERYVAAARQRARRRSARVHLQRRSAP